MSRRSNPSANSESEIRPAKGPVSLKALAAYLGLSPTTLSLVLNGSALANTIPQETKDRIFEAARKFDYRPNFIARSLRSARTYTLGVLVPELSDGYSAMVLSGVEDQLLKEGYFYFVASHRHRADLIERYPRMLLDRCVEGLIAVDTPVPREPHYPVVTVSGHHDFKGLTNVLLDHRQAAKLALEYLVSLGHRQIAVIKGQEFSSDTRVRWEAIREESERLGLSITPPLVAQLEGDLPSPETGFVAARKLLSAGRQFTALFAFNDVSAIGAIRAFQEAGYRVPDEISVIGFDNIYSAEFHNPALTTIGQPLREMGRQAAEYLLKRIAEGPDAAVPEEVVLEPQLIIRQSTAIAGKIES
ncbi:MAG TPA: LacI family DNA-binding transcriptional regulator [Blastocatellia bacterium]|nr:LacI family DNA-binding transcriptional regulator [Blastocatellia bacterium]